MYSWFIAPMTILVELSILFIGMGPDAGHLGSVLFAYSRYYISFNTALICFHLLCLHKKKNDGNLVDGSLPGQQPLNTSFFFIFLNASRFQRWCCPFPENFVIIVLMLTMFVFFLPPWRSLSSSDSSWSPNWIIHPHCLSLLWRLPRLGKIALPQILIG